MSGNRLVAVVGGKVAFTNDPVEGTIQRDGGGTIVAVDRSTDLEIPLTPLGPLFRHPALAPSGTRLVAEVVLGGTTDLWLVAVP